MEISDIPFASRRHRRRACPERLARVLRWEGLSCSRSGYRWLAVTSRQLAGSPGDVFDMVAPAVVTARGFSSWYMVAVQHAVVRVDLGPC